MLKVLLVLLLWNAASAQNPIQKIEFSFNNSCENRKSEVTLALTGDFLVHDALYKRAVQSPDRFFSLVKKTVPLFKKADFSYLNLEGPTAMGIDAGGHDHGDIGFVYDLKVYSGTNFSFNYHPSIISDLKKLGIGIVSTSNNHALDRTSVGVDKTVEAFRQQSDVAYVGTRLSTERSAPLYTITQVQGFNIAWVSCTEATNAPKDKKNQLFYCYDSKNELFSTLRELANRSDVDAVIVTPHWGREYSHVPSKSQTVYAKKFLEAGATAVIGAHPHVLQPWEKYVTADGRETLIAYSLGNFLAFQAGIEKKTSAIIYLRLQKDTRNKTSIAGAVYTPTYRDGYNVLPSRSSEVLDHASRFFGRSSLRMVEQRLWTPCP